MYGWVEGESHKWYGDRKQSTVLEFDKPQKNEEHPTMKPVSLIQYQIMNSTQKHDIVLDLFEWSGTTLIACEQSGRKAYIMEKDPQYVGCNYKRYEEYTGKSNSGGAGTPRYFHAKERTFDTDSFALEQLSLWIIR